MNMPLFHRPKGTAANGIIDALVAPRWPAASCRHTTILPASAAARPMRIADRDLG
jgi:hypothetical protein